MFGRICKRLMTKRQYLKVLDFIKYNFVVEDVTFSQNCEDLIADSFFDKNDGFYVDIGAHHPFKFSNTYRLYLRGWSGINIDPLPECMNKFNKYRPNDINLNIGISEKDGYIDYYSFEEAAYNTINQERANSLIRDGITSLKEKTKINVYPLKDVLNQNVGNRIIDFMNIDVETMEMSVLKSNDWNKYRPKLISMESIVSYNESIDNLKEDEAIQFLLDYGYKIIAKAGNAVFFTICD